MIRHNETTGVSLARIHGDTWNKRKNGRQQVKKRAGKYVQEVTNRKHKKNERDGQPVLLNFRRCSSNA